MPPKEGGTFEFVSISVVSLCETASWCERAAGLVSGRLLAIARAPFSVDSLTVLAGMALVIAAEIIVLGYAKSSLYRLLHPTKSTWADIVWFLVRIFGLQSLDGVAIVLSTVVLIHLLGGTMGESLFVLVLFGAHAGLTHSMLPWRWGWFGKYVLYSPIGHRIHHSALPEHKDKNLGFLFPVWDWMFGTYYKGDVINEEVGVEDNYQNTRGLLFDLAESTRRAWRSVGLPTAPWTPARPRRST